MAVRATHFTLLNLGTSLRYAFSKTEIQSLDSLNVVKVQSPVVTEATINTTFISFVITEPFTQKCRPFVSLAINVFSIFRFRQSSLPPSLNFDGIVSAFTRSTVSLLNFVRISFPPSTSGFSSSPLLLFSVHNRIISHVYPCKPDIFEATYEVVEEADDH